MKNYQIESYNFLLKEKKCVLADAPRVGKTLPTCQAIKAIGEETLVACNIAAKQGWIKYFNELGISYVDIDKEVNINQGKQVYLVNYEKLDNITNFQRFVGLSPKVIVSDEAHRMKNEFGGRSRCLERIISNSSSSDSYVFALTGTPYFTRVDDVESLLKLVGRSSDKALLDQIRTLNDLVAHSSTSDDLTSLIAQYGSFLSQSGCLLRRGLQDVGLSNMVNKKIIHLGVDCEESDDEFSFENATKWGFDERYQDKVDHTLAYVNANVYSRSDRINGLAKVQGSVDYIREILRNKKRVVIFGWHKEVLSEIAERLGVDKIINGEKSQKDKIKIVEDFQKGVDNIIILNHKSGGEGLDLSMDCDDVIIVEPYWTNAQNTQSESRIINIGKENSGCTVHYLFSNSLVDKAKFKVLDYRARIESLLFSR